MDEREQLKAQIKAYEYYAGLIERAIGGGAQPRLPRWDEQRAQEYRDLAAQLKQRLAELEAQDAAQAASVSREKQADSADQALAMSKHETSA